MINNRQGGRRRGRGGQRGPNLGGQPGNRQDNRQRGNAAQLLEKYKNLARDAQLAGDRVQTEYYLQYADHYFRVLGENRSRFEDQRRQRGDELDEDEREEEMAEAEADAGDERDEREEREQRRERPRGRDRDRGQRRLARDDRSDDEFEEQPEAKGAMNGGDSLPLDVLPPAIGADSVVTLAPDEEAPVRPRRRSRAARPAEGEDDVAPAA